MKEEQACDGLFPWLTSVCPAWTLHLLFHTLLAGQGSSWSLLGHGVSTGDKLPYSYESKMSFFPLSAINEGFFCDKPLGTNRLFGSSGRSSRAISSSSGQNQLY